MTDYSKAGVDINLGDTVSAMLYEAAKASWARRQGRIGEVIEPTGDFSGLRAIRVGKLPDDAVMGVNYDGVGTKVEVAERVGDFSTLGFDLLAMVCDDAVIRGGEPVLVGSVLDVNMLPNAGSDDWPRLKSLIHGYEEAAKAADVAIINGELAELGSRVGGYGPFTLNWGASVVWFAHEDRLITNRGVKPGQRLLALGEHGFRSNGLSLVRKIFLTAFGRHWEERADCGGLGEATLRPSIIYSPLLVTYLGGFGQPAGGMIHLAAHITGGGLPGKLARALSASGLGAEITTPRHVPDVMALAAEAGHIALRDQWQAWNMGHGMVVVADDPAAFQSLASSMGFDVSEIGEIIAEPEIRINSGSDLLRYPVQG